MKLFISWSGERSGKVAEQLRDWLSYMFEAIEPWVSRSDIEPGARWSTEIQEELAATSFGILCLTRENVAAPWLLFEAGALAKTLTDTFVVPFLLDLRPPEVPSGPLTQFQAKFADRQGTWELVKGINTALKDKGREQDKLARVFERWWPDLEQALAQIFAESAPVLKRRPVDEMIEEILIAVRNLERRLPGAGGLPPLGFSGNVEKYWEEFFDREIERTAQPNLFVLPGNKEAVTRFLKAQRKKESEENKEPSGFGAGTDSTGEDIE